MKYARYFYAALIATMSLGLSGFYGCMGPDSGGSSGSPAAPSYPPQLHFHAQALNNGVYSAWANATIAGGADQGVLACPNGNSNGCTVYFADITNSNGDYTATTIAPQVLAVPAAWTVKVTPDNNCSSGAGIDTYLTNDSSSTLTCGTGGNLLFHATPSSCTITHNLSTYTTTSTCSSTVTVTSDRAVFPTAYATRVSYYDDSGTEIANSSAMASSSTAITVPAPTPVGNTGVVFYDSANNPVAATSFIINEVTVGSPPSPGASCPTGRCQSLPKTGGNT